MGNCQAVDAAVLVIQHPDGKLEKMYWSMSASEVMRKNPDHYVTPIMPVPESPDESNSEPQAIKSTHVKLLRSSDTLCLGSSYRLVSSKGVPEKTTTEDIFKVTRKRSRPPAKKPSMRRSKSWHPSLKTISEISSQ